MKKNDRPRDEAMAEVFREDPGYAVAALDGVLANGDQDELQVTLQQMTLAGIKPSEMSSIEETRYLQSIPGMTESILESMKEPLKDSKTSDELDW